MNAATIERSLRLLVVPGATFEIRGLGLDRGHPVTLSGYFTDPAVATAAIMRSCAGMIGVYTTLNPVRPELLARCANRIARAGKNGTTADVHVIRRTRLLIDIDGVPVAGISASAAEHAAALELAADIEADLTARGWPRPLRGDSGNGAHLDYAIDLPANDAPDGGAGLVERVLRAAHARYGRTVGDGATAVTLKIDASNKNPARITKVFGTAARKGDNMPDRPHRVSSIIAAPETLEVVPRELLEAFAAAYTPAAAAPTAPRAARAPGATPLPTLDAAAWLADHGVAVRSTKPWDGGTVYELEVCPANPDHNRGEAHVKQHASGAISAGCFHDTCTWDWTWFRDRTEGDPAARAERRRAAAAPVAAAPAPAAAPADDLAARRQRKQRSDARDQAGEAPPSAAAPARPLGHPGIGPGGGYRLTDLGNARRFADQQRDLLRYVQAWDKWLTWDGRRWQHDGLNVALQAAKGVVSSIYADAARVMMQAAAAVGAGEVVAAAPVDELTKHARESAKRGRVEAMISLARSEPELARSHDTWDRDQWRLNVRNGIVDLRTGEVAPHHRDSMLTMLADVDYDPEATCPRFEAFLARVQPDAETRAWIQRYLGYAITGDVREQCLAFFYGDGSNGKSVLLDVVLDIIGTYGLRAAPDLVLAKHGEAHPTELADLEGKRLVVCSEIEQGRMWAESTIKRITGDRTITARRMRQDFYTFPATHKLIVAANTRPVVRGTDHGIWRRMRLVPWSVTIPDAEQDRTLPQQLVETESSGILAWLVRGCLGWQNRGLDKSQAIAAATESYRAEQDVLGRWIEDCCLLGGEQATASLYVSYASWCKDEGVQPWARRTFSERMLERDGIRKVKLDNGSVRALRGVSLR